MVIEGDDKLTDLNCIAAKTTPRPNHPLPYETRTLTAWFDRCFKAAGVKR